MLRKKLFRTMKVYRGQFISMIIMVALGLCMVLGFNMEWWSIELNTSRFYEECGFADYRAYNESAETELGAGFTGHEVRMLEENEEIDAVSRVLTVNTVNAKDDDTVQVVVTENFAVGGFMLTSGAPYDEDEKDGVWMSDKYAAANGYSIGDTVTLTYSGTEISGEIIGLMKAADFLICTVDETQLMPDYDTYGYIYMSPAKLKEILGGVYYPALYIRSDADKETVSEIVNDAVGETVMLVGKDDVTSYSEAQGEADEGKTMGTMLPVIFLLIAVLTMVTTMHRITSNEKKQIGILKALGFKNRRILLHYTSYAVIVAAVSSVIGIALGYVVCYAMMNENGAMGTYFDMPYWDMPIPWFLWVVIALVDLFLVLIGFLSTRKMLAGTAADTLRPYVPKKVKPLLLEKTKLWDRFSFGTRWNLRDVMRHKARSLMSLFGILACAVIILAVCGLNDTIVVFADKGYRNAYNYENEIYLAEGTDNGSAAELADKYNGELTTADSIEVAGEAVALMLYEEGEEMIRLMDEKMNYFDLSPDGAYISARVAEDTGAAAGDSISFSPYGSDKTYTVKVAAVIKSVTKGVYMTFSYAESIGYDYSYTGILTDTAAADIESSDPRISSVQNSEAVRSAFDTFMTIFYIMVILLLVAGCGLGVIVLYNLGTLSYVERYREMATLKVVGFKNRRIGQLLISQNTWLTVAGLVLGIPAGYGVLVYLMYALGRDYEVNIVVKPLSYVITVLLTLGTSLLVGVLIARKNRKIDMVAALKRED